MVRSGLLDMNGTAGLPAGLGGAHWGLLPALLAMPWLAAGGDWSIRWLILMAGVMACYDVATRRIPNALTAITALSGLAWGLIAGGPSGGLEALLGGATGFALMALFYFLGAVGAGDVKALGALATFLNPMGAVYLLVFTTLAGGVMAVFYVVASRREGKPSGLAALRLGSTGLSLPYGLAIFVGALALVSLGGI